MARTAGVGLVLAVSLALGASGASAAPHLPKPRASASKNGPLLRTTFSTRIHGRSLQRGFRPGRLPRSFVGFGFEYQFLFQHLGRPDRPDAGPNLVFYRLMQGLTRLGSGPPGIRLGGGSSDGSWWDPERLPKPRGIFVSLQPWMVGALRAYYEATRSPLVLGLNLGLRRPAYATEWAKAAMAALPRGAARAFEIGNEPDIYPARFLYRDSSGRDHFTRGRHYGFRQWLPEFGGFLRVLRRLRPRPPLAGPTACCYLSFERGLRRMLRRYGRRLKLVTYHRYALDGCLIERQTPPGSRAYRRARIKWIRVLLNRDAIGSRAREYGILAATARHWHLNLRMTETAPVACKQPPGIGDSNASAMWAVDWLFSLWFNRVAGVNFFSAGGPSAPFGISFVGRRRFLMGVRPLFYGVRLFAEASARRARLVLAPVFLSKVRRGARLSIWPTLQHNGTGRMVVLNKGNRRGGDVSIKVRRAARGATVAFLRMPSLYSTTGISWAGQTYGRPTDGDLVGTRIVRRLHKRHGRYRFFLPRASAALVTIPHAG